MAELVGIEGVEGNVTVEIVDMNGRTVSRSESAESQLTIDITNLAQGAYFVRVTGSNASAVRKLIVR